MIDSPNSVKEGINDSSKVHAKARDSFFTKLTALRKNSRLTRRKTNLCSASPSENNVTALLREHCPDKIHSRLTTSISLPLESVLKACKQSAITACTVEVVFLDDTTKGFTIGRSEIGQSIFLRACEHLNLVEFDYFGITFHNKLGMKVWLNSTKPILQQLHNCEPRLYFEVKFYPPDPLLLQEELTRYLFCLQLRHDIASGTLPCAFSTYALLGSYVVQSELGDYCESEDLSGFVFAPEQNDDLLQKISEIHRCHVSQSPAEADINFLKNAKRLAMYGTHLYKAKDSNGININVGVSFHGISVYRDKLRLNRFAWAKILKIFYKRNIFNVKLRDNAYEGSSKEVGFWLINHKAAKRLWQMAVEYHAFFRLKKPEDVVCKRTLPPFNLKFRFANPRTYSQILQLSIDRECPPFERSFARRRRFSAEVNSKKSFSALPTKALSYSFLADNMDKKFKNVKGKQRVSFVDSDTESSDGQEQFSDSDAHVNNGKGDSSEDGQMTLRITDQSDTLNYVDFDAESVKEQRFLLGTESINVVMDDHAKIKTLSHTDDEACKKRLSDLDEPTCYKRLSRFSNTAADALEQEILLPVSSIIDGEANMDSYVEEEEALMNSISKVTGLNPEFYVVRIETSKHA